MTQAHGRTNEYHVGEDLFIEGLDSRQRARISNALGVALDVGGDPLNTLFRYGRMFRTPNLPEFRPDSKGLIALGQKMGGPEKSEVVESIPAGYVYFGQFVDHDLSFDDKSDQMPMGATMAEEEYARRSPALDLDSLYGFDPEQVKQTPVGKFIYEPDGIRLRLDKTVSESSGLILSRGPKAKAEYGNDLPRGFDPQRRQKAAIVDPRNDENLVVAQTHVSFIKFHNAVVKWLEAKGETDNLFEKARTIVVQHYQWIILTDYLPKIIDEHILEDVLVNGCKHLIFEAGEDAFMPIEFSVGAYRLGHAMVNELYNWNDIFQSPEDGDSWQAHLFRDLFTFTGSAIAPMLGQNNILSSWIIDWTRFYKFDFPDVKSTSPINFARKIGPSVVRPLMGLPQMPNETANYLTRLPVRSLLRGRLLGLPAGQCIARRINEAILTEDEIADGDHKEVLELFGLHKLTPLWYYVLKEAELRADGKHLGPVGSRILAETFVGLMKPSRFSILPAVEPGKPIVPIALKEEANADRFTMPDMLYFIHQQFPEENFINPLGDH
jgi:hypothetical protein